MRLTEAIDRFIADRRAEGRINSPLTERVYRGKLDHLAETVGNRDPALVGGADIAAAPARWEGQSRRQAIARRLQLLQARRYPHHRAPETPDGNCCDR